MCADWRARLDAEFEASQGYKPNSADWLDGRWAGMKIRARCRRPAPWQHRRCHRDAEGNRRADHRGAGGLPRPSHRPAFSRDARQGDRRRPQHRLGDRRGARLLLTADRWPSGAAVRSGQRARHVLAAPFRADRSGKRKSLHPVQRGAADTGPLRSHQFDALGGSRARLRVWLLARRAECLDPVGSAVRRFRQRRAGRHSISSSPQASANGCACRASCVSCRTATKGRGRSIPPRGSKRFLQMCAEDNMQVANCTTPANYFSRPAPAIKARNPQAAHPDDAEIASAPQARDLAAGRNGRGKPRSIACLWGRPRSFSRTRRPGLFPTTRFAALSCVPARSITILYEEREKRGVNDVYLLRRRNSFIRFQPRRWRKSSFVFAQAEMMWCQEEPRNMGAWYFRRALSRMGAQSDRSEAPQAALCCASGVGFDRGRPVLKTSGAAQTIARRGARIICRHPEVRTSKGDSAKGPESRMS